MRERERERKSLIAKSERASERLQGNGRTEIDPGLAERKVGDLTLGTVTVFFNVTIRKIIHALKVICHAKVR